MKTIWKFGLEIVDSQRISMPRGAEILSVGNQRDTLCMWASVDAEAPLVNRCFEIRGTGEKIPHSVGNPRKFVGTVIMEPFVWHVFERIT
jgi:hypothetical protein